MPLAFRSVHYDFRSRNGFQWPFPGQTAEAVGPFDPDNMTGCPSYDGDGICLATTAAGAASGGIPMHTVLVCEYDEADVLGQGQNGGKIRVRKAKILSVDDFPAILRGVTRHADPLPTKANLSSANLSLADLPSADLSGANLPGANLRSADLSGTFGDRWTALPEGYSVSPSGSIVREGAA